MFKATYDVSHASQSWMEHEALEHVKRALRVTTSWQSPAISYQRKRQSVEFALESFTRHLERLMDIEEQDGYLRMVVESKPSKAKQIAKLRDEHQMFRDRTGELLDAISDLGEWEAIEFERICAEIGQLLDDIDRHDRAEINLLQDAMLLDEGVGD
ncbi:hypothetical protein NG895_16010 [Aeoliella sp. ICT_H6.2]|uniref:Uncharacterized protein n=1 Tax=Aeoliella straminimaris TaxID=2954799 RepID=A0A9X2JGV9_9BACT|nr:hypothetical protein [Aeoliella straminimaris]MCO6045415.1 hypothetical protein [Aeoliella straminimaris]